MSTSAASHLLRPRHSIARITVPLVPLLKPDMPPRTEHQPRAPRCLNRVVTCPKEHQTAKLPRKATTTLHRAEHHRTSMARLQVLREATTLLRLVLGVTTLPRARPNNSLLLPRLVPEATTHLKRELQASRLKSPSLHQNR